MHIGKITRVHTIKIKGIPSALEMLTEVLEKHGPIPAARLSSATVAGWHYKGIADYEIRLGRDNKPVVVCLHRAGTHWRSIAKAKREFAAYLEETGKIEVGGRGYLNEQEAANVLRWLAAREGVLA